ncbi:MAG TPA: NAD(P)H:quinone oxidoreductase [Nitrospirota bacterium]|nr:NAD(P)H:quinone oxidoreductase [Nitrospirota bacterium]
MAKPVSVLVLYYSMFGNVAEMAGMVAEGVDSVGGAKAVIKQVPDLLPEKLVQENEAIRKVKEKYRDVPTASQSDLEEADAVIVGTPTRFGNMCAQMRNFWDQTGRQWMQGSLIGKPAGVFTSTASIHGGQETTIIATMFTLIHHGMIIVGVPYSVKELVTTVSGGTPYGPSHTAGMEADQAITGDEKKICFELGRRVAEVTIKLRG